MGKECMDGFIMRDGEFIAIDDVERMLEQAQKFLKTPQEIIETMLGLARECLSKGKLEGAQAYFERVHAMSDSDSVTACCLLSIGQIKEKQEDIASAIEWYHRAFRLEPGNDETWYFLNNNLGYCLNLIGNFREAMDYCRKAIALHPKRHNAHKNLGIALEGLGEYLQAASSYLTAAENCPEDIRALKLLESLVSSHPEIEKDLPTLQDRIRNIRLCL